MVKRASVARALAATLRSVPAAGELAVEKAVSNGRRGFAPGNSTGWWSPGLSSDYRRPAIQILTSRLAKVVRTSAAAVNFVSKNLLGTE